MTSLTTQMAQALRHFLLAVQFFTRIPVTGRLAQWVGYSPALLRASVAHFPAVGYIVGAWAALVWWGVMTWMPASHYTPLLAAVLSTAATMWLTGGFHEDGLADVADGLGGYVSRDRALEIMKDSRIGAYGAMALVMSLLTKVTLVALLGDVHPAHTALTLWLAHVVSRTCPLLTIRSLPHVGDAAGSKSKPLADQISTSGLIVGLLWGALAFLIVGLSHSSHTSPISALLMGLLGAVVGWGWTWRLLQQRLGGFTGDGLGTTQQLAELGCLCAMLWAY